MPTYLKKQSTWRYFFFFNNERFGLVMLLLKFLKIFQRPEKSTKEPTDTLKITLIWRKSVWCFWSTGVILKIRIKMLSGSRRSAKRCPRESKNNERLRLWKEIRRKMPDMKNITITFSLMIRVRWEILKFYKKPMLGKIKQNEFLFFFNLNQIF